DQLSDWQVYFKWQWQEIIYFGLFSGLFIVLIDLIMMKVLPKRMFDDGGINERIFTSLSVNEIVGITMLIAVSEELLFRGVMRTVFGYIFASTLFALMHIRYLRKPVLLVSFLFVIFFMRYLFKVT